MPDSPYLDLKQAAALVGVSVKTIRRRIEDGTLPATKFGGVWRVRRVDLEHALTPKKLSKGRRSANLRK